LLLHGELDLATVSGLTETMSRTSPSGGSPLTLDLSDLALCSCAGLSALLVEHLRRLATGSGLILATPSAGVRWILSVTGLDATFDIRPPAAGARPKPTDPDTAGVGFPAETSIDGVSTLAAGGGGGRPGRRSSAPSKPAGWASHRGPAPCRPRPGRRLR
jgi:anti-anti-sigma factor